MRVCELGNADSHHDYSLFCFSFDYGIREPDYERNDQSFIDDDLEPAVVGNGIGCLHIFLCSDCDICCFLIFVILLSLFDYTRRIEMRIVFSNYHNKHGPKKCLRALP